MILTPPPPKPPRTRIVPPKPQTTVVYSPDISDFVREYAVSVFGGFPQVPYAEAERSLMRKCFDEGFEWVGPAAIWILERRLNQQLKELCHDTKDEANPA